MNISKKEAMNKWLESNPGKTERDWLLEERCESDEQRLILMDILACCDADDIRIPAGLYLNKEVCCKFMEKEYSEKYYHLLKPDLSMKYKFAVRRPEMFFNGSCLTTLQFDFSLFGKYYFDLDSYKGIKENCNISIDQWKQCVVHKLGEVPRSEAEDLASLFIESNSKWMSITPPYDLESSEFRNILESEVKRKKYIKDNGLDKIPPSRLIPGFNNTKIDYSLRPDTHQLTIGEFIQKITSPNICKGGRLVISFIDIKDNCLNFPDEAAENINKNGEICSGYYDEMAVFYPEIIDFKRMIDVCDLSKLMVARTKRHGTIPVLDVVPFEWDNYAFTAIVVDAVLMNGTLSKVRDWI